jgi:hypothetical protein
MARPSPPPERTLKSRSTRKRLAAARYEQKALKLRAEAHQLEQEWLAYCAEREAQKAAS